MKQKLGKYFLMACMLMLPIIAQAKQLIVYSSVPGRTASDKYSCRVREAGTTTWQNAFVIQTTCKVNPSETSTTGTDTGYMGNIKDWSASFIAFEFEGMSVEVEISKKDGSAITKAMVRPMADASAATISGGKAFVTFSKNSNVNVDIDGQMEDHDTGGNYSGPAVHTMAIFANPVYIAPSIPKTVTLQPGQDIRSLNRADWDAIIFAPGVHNIGTAFEIQSNEILYIPGNAIVHGTIHPNASTPPKGWQVYGSGAISGENLVWGTSTVIENKTFTHNSEGARLEGFVVIDPANHTFNMGNSGTTTNVYKNLKIFGWRKNADGINAFENSDVSDCFIRTQDDIFYLGYNVKIHNITTWTDSNGAVMYLARSDANSYFKDIKVIYNRKKYYGWNSGVISMRNTDGDISNVLCQNINVEDPFPTVALFYGTINTSKEPAGGFKFSNIVFDNITQAAARVDINPNTGVLNKMDLLGTANSPWKNITIKNCKYKGQDMTSFDSNWNISSVDQTTVKFVISAATQYTISASAGANGSISPSGSVLVNSGTSQSFTITPNSGYQVDVVTVDGASQGSVASYTFSNVAANHSISATYKVIPITQYTITASAGANGSISPSGSVLVNSGTSQSFTITPNSGYQVDVVTVDGASQGSVASYTFSNVTANHSISATYKVIPITQYTITASAGANGSISPSGSVLVNSGASQSYTITPNSGYQVDVVTVDGASQGSVTSYTFSNVTVNHTIGATFKAIVSGSPVAALTGWVSGTTNAKVSGSNRLMTVMVMGESTTDFTATSVTYGGQVMTKQTEKLYTDVSRTYVAIFTLGETGVNAALTGAINVTWSVTPSAGSNVYSVLLSNIDQTTPISVTATNALTGLTVSTTSALAAASGDMVIMCGATANNNTITFANGFTKQFESNSTWGDGVGGNKMGTGASETPSFSQSASGRMVLCAIVAKQVGSVVVGLPYPWVTADIGVVGATGNATYSGSTFTVVGSGADVIGAADAFRYVSQGSSDDCSIVAKVTGIQNTNAWAKAGVMIRESTVAGSPNIFVFVTPISGVSLTWRATSSGSTDNSTAAVAGVTPKWLKLTRVGNVFTAYRSDDGNAWTQVGTSQTINMATKATMGLAVTSHADGTLCTSTMDNVTATP